jgi:hypothetical protein
MEVNEVVLVNEVNLGDDTTTHSITAGVVGSGNAPDQLVIVDTRPLDPQTVSTLGPTDSHTVGNALILGDVSTNTSAYENKHRQKTSKVWDDFSQIEVLGVKKS